ncbi:Spy/CpxP family protein refolding chaperone [Tunturibacter empetritectus]|uniref:Spy/CpxP family protein refolding chaperone n=1 Tax=Tunturiibacter lichenicola TaxID=2051959 RepID=A0A7W8J5Y1_9BACT|nr:Spy/CpxP family protein refolding chaperone [Edaphobacter lichenicola]MBB5343135.1 Spy/CpxP family protein refolding chaperone [Edaphobacter lichenicola]
MTTLFRKPVLQVALLALCTTMLSALPTMAQDPAPPPAQDQAGPPNGGHRGAGQREEHQIEFLTKKLNLTPDQVTQVKAIDDDSRTQMMALRQDTATPQADKRAKMIDIHKASQAKIRAVLTDDQKTKYDALQAQMKERRESREGGQGATPPPPPQ